MSYSQIYVHLVFSTKNRERCLTEPLRKELFAYLAGALREEGCQPVIVGGYVDHVHALFALSRSKSVSDLVRDLKANSSKWLKGKMGTGFAWQSEYGIFSVGHDRVETVRNYIANQAEHHRTRTFQEELVAIYNSLGIKYDERYIWK